MNKHLPLSNVIEIAAIRPAEKFIDRFLDKVSITGDGSCWFWMASTTFGYGKFKTTRLMQAHRASYEFFRGRIPNGLLVLHRCDNPGCVNPAHLFLGTHADNVADKMAKGRQAKGEVLAKHRRLLRGERNNNAKLTNEQVLSIRSSRASLRDLAAQYDVAESAISRIRNGKRWGHL